MAGAGNLNGTTYEGGNLESCKAVPRYSRSVPARMVTETTLYSFAAPDGAHYYARWRSPMWRQGCGILFKLTPSNRSLTEAILYSFTGKKDGSVPSAGRHRRLTGPMGVTPLGKAEVWSTLSVAAWA